MSEKRDPIPPAAVIALRALIAEMQRIGAVWKADPRVADDQGDAPDVWADALDALLARVEPQEGTLNEFGLPEQLYPNTLQSYRTPARVEPLPQEDPTIELIGEVAQWDIYRSSADVQCFCADLLSRLRAAHRAQPTQEPT